MDTQHVTFPFTDDRARSIGYLITTSEIDMVPATDDRQYTYDLAPGHYFVLDGHYTVNSKPYGVSPPQKLFHSASSRRFAIDTMVADARDRAFNKTPEGSRLMAERRHQRHANRSTSRKSTTADKLARRQAKETEAANKIPNIEAEIQVLLDNADFMEYLKTHPWPHVIPGPPSMSLTAYDHIVEYSAKQIDHIYKYNNHDDPKQVQLGVLKNMLQMLKEQVRRFSKGLPPESATFLKFFGR